MTKKTPPIIIGVFRNGALFLLLLSALFTSAQNPKIKCYFNHPVNTAVSTGTNAIYLNGTFVDSTVAYINRSKYSLDLSVYNYTYNTGDGLDAIATAVNAAANRGVIVRWIYDGVGSNTGLPLLNSNVQTLGSPTSFSYGIMHNKFMIIDANSTNLNDPIVWTGSFNFSRNQSDVDFNNIIIFQDKLLAQGFTTEFNKMWGSTGPNPNTTNSKFGPFKTPSAQTSYTVNGTPVDVYFSPMDNVGTKLMNCISTAGSDLFFGIFTFTDSVIANSIKAKYNAGVAVKGIMDSYSMGFNAYPILNATLGNNMKVYSSTGTYHNKTMLIDALTPWSDPQTFTGSFNWSLSAQNKNDENSVVVHDATVTNQYYQSLCKDFTDLGGAACSLVGIENFDHSEERVAVFPNPATDKVTVMVKNAGHKTEVIVCNALGEALLQTTIEGSNAAELNTADLPAGIYFISIRRGEDTFIRKLVRN